MTKLRKFFRKAKTAPVILIGCILLIFVCLLSLWSVCLHSNESTASIPMRAVFRGDYRIGDGEWRPIREGEKISAVQGDVTLKGFFEILTPDGESLGRVEGGVSINFYFNHIGGEIRVGEETYTFDAENPLAGADMCGEMWIEYAYPDVEAETVEITLKNPHSFGNESAVNEFLENFYFGSRNAVASYIAPRYDPYRIIGFFIIAVSLILFGFAVVASALRLSDNKILWILSAWMAFTGGYYMLETLDVALWVESVVFTTFTTQICLMLSVFFLGQFTRNCLTGKRRKAATVAQGILGVLVALFAIAAACGAIRIYDTERFWRAAQTAAIAVFTVCGIAEIRSSGNKEKIFMLSCCLLSLWGILADFIGNALVWWRGAVVGKTEFGLIFLLVLALSVKTVVSNYRTAMKAEKLESELKEKRMAIMISQIQPHFLFNSLNSIAELCETNPTEAQRATVEFSEYLRGNMSALNKKTVIEFTDELKHLSSYIALEQIRFGDSLKFEYDIRSTQFTIPALTIQPLVENAVKHGIRTTRKSGTVRISTFEDEENHYVTISDDGSGFDSDEIGNDGKEHVGIANVRYRLEVMCGGRLEIDSKKGEGTTVKIILPKEKRR